VAGLRVLVLNAGSSSQKTRAYQLTSEPSIDPQPPVWEEKLEWDTSGDHRTATEQLLRRMPGPKPDVAGHRVVHGGGTYHAPTLITPKVRSALAQLAGVAPLHNRAALEGMDIVEQLLGAIPQVAVFDTAFHRDLPLPAAVYPGPYDWFKSGIRRYGFHGINHAYCAARAAALLDGPPGLRLVICHLGNGCSLAAVRDGHSVDTTMGFTPLEGLMMGTRSGSLDPGILTYLLEHTKLTPDQLDHVLNSESGLWGVSGVSADMRRILAAMREGNARAKLAFDIYVHRLRAGIAAMTASLGGLDALVFTAGVGEHSAEVRAAACEPLSFLGLELDRDRNALSPFCQNIAARASKVRVLIIPAEEDWMIARACWRFESLRRD
jgi:acetate kinase